jgi:DNA invertase Pin-like site-specific DNA recombinase
MSTDSQVCSPKIQRDAIAHYALQHGIEIVRSYKDEGKSGLSIDGRDGLRSLLTDIERGDHDFAHLLVFDVSRWGRFQDVDESAYYEFLCRKAGVQLTYCGESFENDGSPYAAVLKSLKRIMAAEFSRDLSQRIYLAQRRHAAEGAHQGGSPGYARRRLLIDHAGIARFPLLEGDRKGLRSDRVVIVPGPPEEVATVREIYRLFLDEGLSCCGIAKHLNETGRLRPGEQPWRQRSVHYVLSSEKYVGANIYGRASGKLKGPRRVNPRNDWLVVRDAFPPIIDRTLYDRVQQRFRAQTRNLSDEDVLDRLRDLWKRAGRVTNELIAADPLTPSPSAIASRFGSLNRALALIGYPAGGRGWAGVIEPNTLPIRFELLTDLRQTLRTAGFRLTDQRSRVITVEGRTNVSLTVASSGPDSAEGRFWRIAFGRHPRIDIGVVIRLAADSTELLDAFVIPAKDIDLVRLSFINEDALTLTRYRVPISDYARAVVGLLRGMGHANSRAGHSGNPANCRSD